MCAWRSLASLLSAWEHRRVARKSCGNYAKVEQFMGRLVVEAKFYCRDNVRKWGDTEIWVISRTWRPLRRTTIQAIQELNVRRGKIKKERTLARDSRELNCQVNDPFSLSLSLFLSSMFYRVGASDALIPVQKYESILVHTSYRRFWENYPASKYEICIWKSARLKNGKYVS